MEGFLTLAQAAQQIDVSLEYLLGEIQAGRVVAIVRDGESWLSPGEVSRLAKASASPTVAETAQPEEDSSLNATAPAAPADSTPPPAQPPPTPEPESEPVQTPAVQAPAPVQASTPIQGPPVEPDQELLRRYEALARQFGELEKINQRLKMGLQETEATLRRNRTAKANLESDIINLQEQLKRAQTRTTALEREVQHLTHQLERAEEKHSSEMRRLRSHERNLDGFTQTHSEPAYSLEEINILRQQMEEKDRIISQEYQERAVLRSQLEERSQKYFELKARYEKEKSEWSEILARELQTHGILKSQLEELRPKNQRGWNPFRRDNK